MKEYTSQLFNYALGATDGEIGKVKDIYFDDEEWTIRYLVVETGNWLFDRKVLISPLAINQSEPVANQLLNVKLSKEQVKSSPDIDTELPISRQQESSLSDHYSGLLLGRAGMGWPTTAVLQAATSVINKAELSGEFDSHLRSFLHVAQYEVHNDNGRVGLVKDLMIDFNNWSIPFLLMDDISTSDNERVIISTEKIISIDLDTFNVKICLNAHEIKSASRINPEGFFSDKSGRQLPPR